MMQLLPACKPRTGSRGQAHDRHDQPASAQYLLAESRPSPRTQQKPRSVACAYRIELCEAHQQAADAAAGRRCWKPPFLVTRRRWCASSRPPRLIALPRGCRTARCRRQRTPPPAEISLIRLLQAQQYFCQWGDHKRRWRPILTRARGRAPFRPATQGPLFNNLSGHISGKPYPHRDPTSRRLCAQGQTCCPKREAGELPLYGRQAIGQRASTRGKRTARRGQRGQFAEAEGGRMTSRDSTTAKTLLPGIGDRTVAARHLPRISIRLFNI